MLIVAIKCWKVLFAVYRIKVYFVNTIMNSSTIEGANDIEILLEYMVKHYILI